MSVPAITDPQTVPTYGPSPLQRWLEKSLVEPRDAVFARQAIKNLLIIAPLQILLYVWFSWPLAVVWLRRARSFRLQRGHARGLPSLGAPDSGPRAVSALRLEPLRRRLAVPILAR